MSIGLSPYMYLANGNIPSIGDKKLNGVTLVQLIDSGGQLQFHDILPSFLQHSQVNIFVLKLSEELSYHPTADGEMSVSVQYKPLSHEEILQYSLGAIQSRGTQPMIITVGTHRDVIHGTETIDKKNARLKTLLNPKCYHVVYTGEDLTQLIFAVNGKDPQDEDRRVAQELRKKIISSCHDKVKLPIAWFGFEILVRRSSHNGILSLAKCKECAKKFDIKGDAFSAALHHLVHHNMFLYYPEVLPQTVFCDPQVVLTIVTELVQYHHKLTNDPDKSAACESDLVFFRDGVVTEAVLRKVGEKHFQEFFTPQDLIQLLVSLHAIAEISKGQYLMPALLPRLFMSKFRLSKSFLVIAFDHGCIPSGLFCCVVAHLLSLPNRWKLFMKRDKPFAVYRNLISFVLKATTEMVTIVDMFSFVEVHVDKASRKLCRKIRDCIHDAIESACTVLKYHNVQYEDSFVCTGERCSTDPTHLVEVCQQERKWRCTVLNDQSGPLDEDQMMWLSENPISPQSSLSSELSHSGSEGVF